jgi:hypothetical protein
MAGQPFGASARRPEGVAYKEVRHEHRATPLSGRAADLFTSSQPSFDVDRPPWLRLSETRATVGAATAAAFRSRTRKTARPGESRATQVSSRPSDGGGHFVDKILDP